MKTIDTIKKLLKYSVGKKNLDDFLRFLIAYFKFPFISKSFMFFFKYICTLEISSELFVPKCIFIFLN